jgi:hypothetical protein
VHWSLAGVACRGSLFFPPGSRCAVQGDHAVPFRPNRGLDFTGDQ